MSVAEGPTNFSTVTTLERVNSIATAKTPAEQLDSVYEVERCCEVIESGHYQRIALQFPDYLMSDAVAVSNAIKDKTKIRNFILGDTSYGSCCVDFITAEHLSADLIIHYGRSCLSPVDRLPVLYVFAGQPMDISHCASTVSDLIGTSTPILLLYDVIYARHADALAETLRQLTQANVVLSSLLIPELIARPTSTNANHMASSCCKSDNKCSTNESTDSCCTSKPSNTSCCQGTKIDLTSIHSSGKDNSNIVESTNDKEGEESIANGVFKKCGRLVELPEGTDLSDFTAVFIGKEGLTLTNLMMNFNKCKFASYNPLNRKGRLETMNVNMALMRRYYLVEKAKDANVVGILLGTLGVADYMGILSHLKKVIAKAGKKSYCFVMGKVNEFKVANFPEIDIFCLIACPENVLIDSKEYYRPVVTPFEMELACVKGKEWTGNYTTDFHDILPNIPAGEEASMDHDEILTDDDEPDFSPLTGTFRRNLRLEARSGATSSAMAVRDKTTDLVPTTNVA
eukprot:Ihof_evm10s120 gene=Ihof_evmTU10s120